MGDRQVSALRSRVLAIVGTTVVLVALTGCTAGGFTGDHPAPTARPSLSPAARRAIAAAREQAESANSPTAPASVSPDTIETWPAVDHGARPLAEGSATETAPGVYRYTVASGDGAYAIALRFGICTVDLGPEQAPDPAQSFPQPDQVLTIQRQGGDPDDHAGAVCNAEF